ncbi:probable beta-1,4-xylosyltransferase IRX9H isoform X1 [Primulina huaijiensis]|uniref:probable beta-1,4-xylosyltransferase IRX9H isoform X1 n=1 Tax=Primulina huaijiensis TaxID=1492673 RepID=UPI003CC7959A
MASIRRTLSPVPRPGALINAEACQVASPLSKSSSNSQNYTPNDGLLASSTGSLDHALYRAQIFILGLFSKRSARPFDRSKAKGHVWRRAFFHFLMCFIAGVFVGLTPFASLHSSRNIVSINRAFDLELLQPVMNEFNEWKKNVTPVVGRLSVNENSTSELQRTNLELKDGNLDEILLNNSLGQDSNSVFHKLLIIVTPSYSSSHQTYYLNRLGNTLKLVPHPLIWIIVEMNSQSVETAELLRNTGIMYRHLVCSIKNSTDIIDTRVLLRNVALSHIETHHLDGIVYFADVDNIYSVHLFDQLRQIRRFGTWPLTKFEGKKGKMFLEGPICNGSQVLGWHIIDLAKRFRRFHTDMSGFAFNSTIIWDPKRWHRPMLEPIRQLKNVKDGFQASTFIEQVVEDESQMECFSLNSSEIMVWHHVTGSNSFPRDRLAKNNLRTFIPLS